MIVRRKLRKCSGIIGRQVRYARRNPSFRGGIPCGGAGERQGAGRMMVSWTFEWKQFSPVQDFVRDAQTPYDSGVNACNVCKTHPGSFFEHSLLDLQALRQIFRLRGVGIRRSPGRGLIARFRRHDQDDQLEYVQGAQKGLHARPGQHERERATCSLAGGGAARRYCSAVSPRQRP